MTEFYSGGEREAEEKRDRATSVLRTSERTLNATCCEFCRECRALSDMDDGSKALTTIAGAARRTRASPINLHERGRRIELYTTHKLPFTYRQRTNRCNAYRDRTLFVERSRLDVNFETVICVYNWHVSCEDLVSYDLFRSSKRNISKAAFLFFFFLAHSSIRNNLIYPLDMSDRTRSRIASSQKLMVL